MSRILRASLQGWKPSEARANLEVWKEALIKDLGAFSKGFRRLSQHQFRTELLEGNPNVSYVPSNVVYTIKPPDQGMEVKFKRKARIVACGNFSKDDSGDLYANGASGETLRCILAEAAHRQWSAGLVDVKGAFMLTPMTDDVVTVVNPPTILVSMGLVERGEKWVLTHAMYGLRQSPGLWSSFRDAHLRRLVGSWEGEDLKFVQGEVEPNLWAIMAENSICGALLVYVDALLICGSSSLIEYVANMVSELWETTKLEVATVAIPVRFLGCEIHDLKPGFALDQLPYIKELLRAHGTPPAQLNDHAKKSSRFGVPRISTGIVGNKRSSTCGEDWAKGAWLLATHRRDPSGDEANSGRPDGLFRRLFRSYGVSFSHWVRGSAAQLPRCMAFWETGLYYVEVQNVSLLLFKRRISWHRQSRR